MIRMINTQRVRAWMVVSGQFDDADAARVLALDDKDRDRPDEYVIVRADLVSSLCDPGPGMVIPIDAMVGSKSKYDYLYHVRNLIAEVLKFDPDNCDAYDLYEVKIPASGRAPHSASGYITIDEAHAAINNGENGGRPGRQDHSPGFNPWG